MPTPIENFHQLPKTWHYRGFAAQTSAEAYAEFARKYPQYAENNPPAFWAKSNNTLYVAWDVKREPDAETN